MEEKIKVNYFWIAFQAGVGWALGQAILRGIARKLLDVIER